MATIGPHSPCISICAIGPQGWCNGCYRTLSEISGWVRMDAEAQWAIVRAAEERRRQLQTVSVGRTSE
jgi:predicted Fe-S protein YdhL (DUF1289 family)